jgi:ABC-type lipoprotein release transport system permease subunit
LLGVDERFWPDEASRNAADWRGDEGIVALNRTLADALGAKIGDRLSFNVQRSEAAPRETLLGKRDDVVQAIRVTVSAILPDAGMARFTLRPNPEPARNAFMPLRFLQKELQQEGKANAVFTGPSNVDLQKNLTAALTLEDWNLKLRRPADRTRDFVRVLDPRHQDGALKKKVWEGRVPDKLAEAADGQGNLALEKIADYYGKHRPYISVESEQMFLDAATENALTAVARTKGAKDPPTPLIYLADSISDGKAEMPYAVIAAVQPESLPVVKPAPLADNEIALATWPGMPLQAKVGDQLTVTYYVPDETSQLQKRTTTFLVGLLIPMEGLADDPDWTPEFRGITDKLSISQWENPPFPYNPKRIKPIDDQYWKRHRATPKAYVTLATGQRLWGNRFGKITSVRFPHPWPDLEQGILKELRPEAGGFVFQNVRALASRASSGSTDFGVLFLSFSFFLIAAALLLVGLLFRLNIDRRAGEMGLLLATGWSHRQVRWLLLAEGLVLAVVGAGVGLLGALLYGDLMLRMLAANWPGGSELAFLRLHVEPMSCLIGYAASVVVSVLTIVWATRILGKMSPKSLLAGETTASVNSPTSTQRVSRSGLILIGSLVGALACLVVGILASGHEAKAGSFFGAGALLLTAALTWVWRRLQLGGVPSDPQPSILRLGARNAGRHPVRSVLTVGLLASATFLITAVEAFHKETGREFLEKGGGSGGFTLIAETDVPIFKDLNDPKTQAGWDLTKDEREALRDVKFYALRVRQGDDASCLNLYQPLKPRILGVPPALRKEGRFRFGGSLAGAGEPNPWKLLQPARGPGPVPAMLDANSAQWILKKKLGETLTITEDARSAELRVVGLLQESIFQGEILIAEEDFLHLFPRREGIQFFLIETDPAKTDAVRSALENALADQGIEVVSTVQRLQSFLAVENMYLETFKALGGLGLLLGAAGLAIVLLRGVWERRAELALLRALGFRGDQLARLVLAENALLLALGLAAGAAAALLAVAPHLAGSGATPLWGRLAILLTLVAAVGLASGAAAIWGSLRTPVLTALRRE